VEVVGKVVVEDGASVVLGGGLLGFGALVESGDVEDDEVTGSREEADPEQATTRTANTTTYLPNDQSSNSKITGLLVALK
jgi:hypothetical protein